MKQLRMMRIELAEDNNDLVHQYLPANYIEIKEIKDVENPTRTRLLELLTKSTNEYEQQWLQEEIAKLKVVKEVYYTQPKPISYEKLVNQLVRERYSESDEFAILRKAINNVTDEYLIYNAYVEECKIKARKLESES